MRRDDVPIRRPCPFRSPSFDGGVCTSCHEPVIDLSAGTEAEAQDWLATRRGGCIAYHTDRRGQVRFGVPTLAATGALTVAAALMAWHAPSLPVPAPAEDCPAADPIAPSAAAAPILPPPPLVTAGEIWELKREQEDYEEMMEQLLALGGYVSD